MLYVREVLSIFKWRDATLKWTRLLEHTVDEHQTLLDILRDQNQL